MRAAMACVLSSTILLTASCGGPGSGRTAADSSSTKSNEADVTLTGAGATFPNPIYTKWFDEYARKRGTRINYQSIGSGGGIRQFIEGTVDFGATDSPMADSLVARVNGNVVHLPTVLGAVVVTYNLPSLGATKLRFDGPALADIFLGKVKRWNDRRIAALNPGVTLPDIELIVVHRSDGSGTSFIWTDYLSKVSPEWKQAVGAATSVNWPTGIGGKGNEGVTQQVKQVEGTIGYVELIYALSNGLPTSPIKNAAGNFVEPDLETTTAAAAGVALTSSSDLRVSITNAPGANAYPAASFTWLLIRKNNPDPSKGRVIQEFLTWMISDEAQAMAGELKYAPLPSEIRDLVRQEIAELGFGSPTT
jgi:phosphate transport system substrate-binding protein